MSNIVFVTGASGTGKTFIVSELRKIGFDAIDLDQSPVQQSHPDGIGNSYDLLAFERLIQPYRESGKLLFTFGLSRNLYDFVRFAESKGVTVACLKVSPSVVAERRIKRGKAYDCSMDKEGHLLELENFEFKVGRKFVLRVSSVGDLLECVMQSPVDLKQRRSS